MQKVPSHAVSMDCSKPIQPMDQKASFGCHANAAAGVPAPFPSSVSESVSHHHSAGQHQTHNTTSLIMSSSSESEPFRSPETEPEEEDVEEVPARPQSNTIVEVVYGSPNPTQARPVSPQASISQQQQHADNTHFGLPSFEEAFGQSALRYSSVVCPPIERRSSWGNGVKRPINNIGVQASVEKSSVDTQTPLALAVGISRSFQQAAVTIYQRKLLDTLTFAPDNRESEDEDVEADVEMDTAGSTETLKYGDAHYNGVFVGKGWVENTYGLYHTSTTFHPRKMLNCPAGIERRLPNFTQQDAVREWPSVNFTNEAEAKNPHRATRREPWNTSYNRYICYYCKGEVGSGLRAKVYIHQYGVSSTLLKLSAAQRTEEEQILFESIGYDRGCEVFKSRFMKFLAKDQLKNSIHNYVFRDPISEYPEDPEAFYEHNAEREIPKEVRRKCKKQKTANNKKRKSRRVRRGEDSD